MTIKFDGHYMLNLLAVLDSKMVQLELQDELNAAAVRPVDGKEYVYIIMLMCL